MTIIAVSGIPYKWSLVAVVNVLANKINGHFEALSFKPSRPKFKRTCYLRLSEKLDPVQVLTSINRGNFGKKVRLHAIIPQDLPDLTRVKKPTKVSMNLRRALKIPDEYRPHEVLQLTHTELMAELQFKYPKLIELSQKTEHELLEAIGRKILERLKEIMARGGETCVSCFNLSKNYRKMHPHFGDFQLVLSTLHSVQDAAGQPRVEFPETELTTIAPGSALMIEKLPFNKVEKACVKYSERITSLVTEHVANLDTIVTSDDTEEERARKRVREELKKIKPYLSLIIREVITNNFIPDKTPYHRIRMYGEPYLPAKELMLPFIRKYNPVYILRSTRMYNLLKLNVPHNQVFGIRSKDGTVVNGAKIIIRSSDMPLYEISAELRAEINAVFEGGNVLAQEHMDEESECGEDEEIEF